MVRSMAAVARRWKATAHWVLPCRMSGRAPARPGGTGRCLCTTLLCKPYRLDQQGGVTSSLGRDFTVLLGFSWPHTRCMQCHVAKCRGIIQSHRRTRLGRPSPGCGGVGGVGNGSILCWTSLVCSDVDGVRGARDNVLGLGHNRSVQTNINF